MVIPTAIPSAESGPEWKAASILLAASAISSKLDCLFQSLPIPNSEEA
jgi:hypothetical protein